MRVLVVSQYFWPEEFQINGMVRSLVERVMQVDVLTGKPNYPEGRFFDGYRAWGCQTEHWMGATVYRVPLLARGAKNAVRLVLNYLSFVLSALAFAPWLLRGRQYDAIFVYAPSPILQVIPALFLGWLKRCRVIVWVQDLWPQSLAATGYVRSPRILHWTEKVVRFIYRHTDLLLVQSRAFEAQVVALAPGKKIVYFPNSVDPLFCDPAEMVLPQIEQLNSGFPVMFAGNIGAGQSVETIVEAAALLQQFGEIQFVVLGLGSRHAWMLEQVRTRGLHNLHLPGRFPIQTMPGLMQKAGALLVTLADQPVFAATIPNKIQAYMAAGRPILACLNGEGARIVVEADAGLAIPAQDAQGLANAVLKLYWMPPDERFRLGDNGRRYYKAHFDRDTLVDKLVGYLAGVEQ